MNPLFRIDFSISDSLKNVRKSVLIYETIIDTPDELQKVTLKEIHWLCDGLSLNPSGAFEEHHPKIVI